jgi:Uma2 family endonuclease
MADAARMRELYDAILALPEGVVGELIDGQLHTQPRPAAAHAVAASRLGADLNLTYDRGRGGPGGWWILDDPELHFRRDREVLVPDMAGWRRERMPEVPEDQRFEVVPGWVCEVLSPSTAGKDRELKLPTYARYGVGFAWIADPVARRVEALRAVRRRDGDPTQAARAGCRRRWRRACGLSPSPSHPGARGRGVPPCGPSA